MEENKNSRKVDLSSLPRKIYRGRECIDWEKSIGAKITFTYDNICGTLELLEFDKSISSVKVGYKNCSEWFKTQHFTKCKITALIGNRNRNHKYKEGCIIGGSIKIIHCFKEKSVKKYKYKCMKDGYIGVISQSNLDSGKGCPVCSNKKVIKEINSIFATHNEYVKYFCDKEVTYNNTYGSWLCADIMCEKCGNIKNMIIKDYFKNGMRCYECGDNGQSYPNKYVYSVFRQLCIDIFPEKIFSWNKNHRYDLYDKKRNVIIENHGIQHYTQCWINDKSEIPIDEQIAIDAEKKNFALNNGIKHYIELDCRYSESEYIKKSILNSRLPQIFGFKEEDVDWNNCDLVASGSQLVQICELWERHTKNKDEILKMVGFSKSTVTKRLKKGSKIGICSYDEKEERSKVSKENAKKQGLCKEVLVYKNDVEVGKFTSVSDLVRKSEEIFGVKFIQSSISCVCMGKQKEHKGYVFEYVKM